MQRFEHAACTWSHTQPSHHADPFSFPPIQRSGLPCPAACKTHGRAANARDARSHDQETNLADSSRRLLDALSIQPLKHAEAL